MSFNPENSQRPERLAVVFGGAGYIGSIVVRQLLAEGYRVRVFDNFLFGPQGVRGIDSPRLDVITGDICDVRAVTAAVVGADVVILLAALVGHLVRPTDWRNVREVNYLASSVVLDAALEQGASRFLFASTSSVYGVQSGIMYETTLPEPVTLYSRLKLRMEERVINAKRSDFHPTALRIATCHGLSPRMRFDLAVNSLVRDAVCGRQINIICGEQYRSFIHVDDAAQAFLACLRAHENLISGEVFNVGAPEQSVKINDLANLVKTFVPDVSVRIDSAPPDLVDYHLNCVKIEKVLDFRPRWTLEQSIEQLREVLLRDEISDPYNLCYQNT